MKITKLHYFDTFEIFQGHRRFQKIGFEAEIDEEYDNVRDCYYALKRKSEELFYESKAATEKQMGIVLRDVEEATIKGLTTPLEEQIKSCNEIKVLESYKFIVKGKPELEQVYNNRLKELT